MSKQIKCPICNNDVDAESYVECYGVVEEYHRCTHCGYCYEFAYGNYMEIVNRREFIWSYTSYANKEQYKNFNKLIQKHIKLHRFKWKLYKASYLHKQPFFTYFCNGGKDGKKDGKKDRKIERIRGGV